MRISDWSSDVCSSDLTGQYGGGNRRYGPDPRLQPPADETRSIGQAGISPPYIAALIGGLLRYPEALRRNEEALTRLPVSDSSDAELLGVMLDSARCQDGLDCEGFVAILGPMKVDTRETTLLKIGNGQWRER